MTSAKTYGISSCDGISSCGGISSSNGFLIEYTRRLGLFIENSSFAATLIITAIRVVYRVLELYGDNDYYGD